MRRLLIFVDWFDPAYMAGGPIRTTVNMALQLSRYFKVDVVTSDRDLHGAEPMKGIRQNVWIEYAEGVHVYYFSKERLRYRNILATVAERTPDVVYCNGMYSRYFTVYPLLMHAFGQLPVSMVVGPHGMLRPSALKFKAWKKVFFLRTLRFSGIPRKLTFHATDEDEVRDIRQQFGDIAVKAVADLPALMGPRPPVLPKKRLHLRAIFIGRVHPIKNLEMVIRFAALLEGTVEIVIVGVVEDARYWESCQTLIKGLPSNVRIEMVGEKTHQQVLELLSTVHVLFLPTRGENFGHAIYEALVAGKPVLISDQTPWKDLEAHKAGFDLDPEDVKGFRSAAQEMVNWEEKTYGEWSQGARRYVEQRMKIDKLIDEYIKLFS